MREVNPDDLAVVRREYEQRLARIGDVLIDRHGIEIMAQDGHPTLDLIDYAINRAIELEWFIDQVVQRAKMLRDLDPRHNTGTGYRIQSAMLGDVDVAGLRTRALAFKLIECRRLMQRLHGKNLGSRELGGLSAD